MDYNQMKTNRLKRKMSMSRKSRGRGQLIDLDARQDASSTEISESEQFSSDSNIPTTPLSTLSHSHGSSQQSPYITGNFEGSSIYNQNRNPGGQIGTPTSCITYSSKPNVAQSVQRSLHTKSFSNENIVPTGQSQTTFNPRKRDITRRPLSILSDGALNIEQSIQNTSSVASRIISNKKRNCGVNKTTPDSTLTACQNLNLGLSHNDNQSKNIKQSADVLKSIGTTRLNFDQTFEEEDYHTKSSSTSGIPSENGPTPEIVAELYSKAENQEFVCYGLPDIQCEYCSASLWFQERAEKSKNSGQVTFSLCCMKGRVTLPFLKKPPQLILSLMSGQDERGNHFQDNIRAYNSMFSFTSIGGKVHSIINDGGGPPQFVLSGQNYHRIGSLLPENGTKPKFAQLYIYDTQNEVQNRMSHFGSSKDKGKFDISLVEDITHMLDQFNKLAKKFRMVRDYVERNPASNCYLRLFRHRSKDPRVYNIPDADEVAGLIVGDLDTMDVGRDIVVKKMSGELQRLHETHTSFIPLQYPLIFLYGEDGFKEDIPISDSTNASTSTARHRVTLREWIAFRIQDRDCEFGNILNTRRLFQQFLVDSYTMVEAQRLSFIRYNQPNIRCEVLNGLQEAVDKGETDPSSIGKRIILPKSFTGGMRYMFNNCQDAMAICKKFGYPDLFITITCNTNWSEINDFVSEKGLSASDRPDIVSRVFKMKLDELMSDLKKKDIFGKANAGMYTVEFQKRGLPHAHILLWLEGENKLKNARDIDKVISAELPDPTLYPKLAEAVANYMIHGPCGAANFKAPCMKDKRCSKYYPKKFKSSTTIDEDGYPCYRRRESGISINRKGMRVDNRSVVPYSPVLLMRYKGHVNTEYCNQSNSIKYLFKYVNKGPDRATIEISNTEDSAKKDKIVDEIKQFYDCRYLSPCEAAWRIFAYDIHERWPPVQRLSFHLLNQQSVIFKDDDRIDAVVDNNEHVQTQFLAWFDANKNFEQGRNLTYAEFPSKFVFFNGEKTWKPRKNGYSLGRLTYIPAGAGELYYMRILLTIQRGCVDYESIRTVDGKIYDTFQDACYALGLLANDREYIDAIQEASEMCSGNQLRKLFVTLLVMNTMSKPDVVWTSTWKLLSDGILYQKRKELNIPDLQFVDEDLQNLCLIELENLLMLNGRSLKQYSCLPQPNLSDTFVFENRFIVDELNYDRAELAELHTSLLQMLTEEQLGVYHEIMKAVFSNTGGFFFLYGYGGTGKTFLWKTLSAALHSHGNICLNVASSGIASLLLPGGRTAHSTFCIPLVINEESTCNIAQGSLRAKLLIEAKLIIWDEAPMMNRHGIEAFDRTLRDLMRIKGEENSEKPFGGKVVVLGGDFRQILPVVRKGSRQQIVKASINSSDIWKSCKVLKLSQNMRLSTASTNETANEIKEFADWILQLGDGDMDLNENGEGDIDIPQNLLIQDSQNPLLSLVDFVYPNILDNMKSSNFFEQGAILAPTIECYEEVNDFILSLIPGEQREYFSSDIPCRSDEDVEFQGNWVTSEFLNDIKCSGIPNHKLVLKVGVPIMLLRNIDQANGLCNGTRLQVKDLGTNIIAATVLTGKNIGDIILLPRMDLVPSDPGFPFKFQRRQFPICLCFAMTINKSQGQSLSKVGLYLRRPVFTHGQLYVAVSRVKSKDGLKILILDDDGEVCTSTKNVVYKEVFENLNQL